MGLCRSFAAFKDITYADKCDNNSLTCLQISYEERNLSTVLMDELYIRKVFTFFTGLLLVENSSYSSLDCSTAIYRNL